MGFWDDTFGYLTGSTQRKKAERGVNKAADELGAFGQEQKDFFTGGLDRATGYYGSADKAYGDLYGQGGQLAGKGYLEDLYEKSAGGSNPFYARARETGTKSINDAFAARGLYNSGAALSAIGNLNADLGAQEARDMERMAGSAQAAREGRLRSGFEGAMGLGAGKAGLVHPFYGSAGAAQQQAKMAELAARMKAAGIDLEQYRDIFGAAAQIGGTLAAK